MTLLRNITILILLAGLPLRAQQVSSNPPPVSLMQVSSPTATGRVVVTGLAGAVPSEALVSLITLDTGQMVQTPASTDGSFSASVYAPAGTSILIKVDQSRAYTVAPNLNFAPLPGTIVRVPDPSSGGGTISFAGAGALDAHDPPQLPAWTFQGTLTGTQYQVGDPLRVQGTLSIVSAALQASSGTLSVRITLGLEKLASIDGSPVYGQSVLTSTVLTPTGLPIERSLTGEGPTQELVANLTRPASDRAELAVDTTLALPSNLPVGYYRPYFLMSFTGVPPEPVPNRATVLVDRIGVAPPNPSTGPLAMYLPVIRVGFPQNARLAWHLLTDTVSNGTRGVGAMEDRTRIGVASRVLTQSETFIIPRLDPATGSPLYYRLEPFLPAISVGDRGSIPNVPRIPFKFPSGALVVTIQRPSGAVQTIGPYPFVQSRSAGALDGVNSQPVGNISDPYQLSTMNPNLSYTFPEDGRYVITMNGSVLDLWGNSWTGGGTYEVYVARDLAMDTSVLPGTQFERGDTFNGGVVVSPAVPADVRVRFRMSPDSVAAQTTDRTLAGVANRFGYFQPAGHGILLDSAGEYRVDITASYTDDQGNLWMGSRTWAGVVAPTTPSIVAHGSRGVDGQPVGNGQQWFFRTQTGLPSGSNSHVFFPFSSGDVSWHQQSDSALPVIRFQDPGGTILSLMRQRAIPSSFDARAAIGEAQLTSTRADHVEPHIDLSAVDLWAYSYRSVQRPLVRVREEISEDTVRSTFWRFNESHARQLGSSPNGDLPNDIRFQYGAAVIRGSALPSPQYAIYGSLSVVVRNSDPGGGTRTFPPFQGNGGGPTGGPIMTLKGRSIDLLFHPTAVRPGSVLEVGDTFSVVGAVAPTLAGLVSTTVTKPNGSTVSFSGRANSIGYYFNPAHDFIVEAPGMYTVDMTVTFDGRTSAGQVTQPYPRGDVLGTTNGRFYVYVVSRGSASLSVSNTDGEILAAPAGVTLTAGSPGFILQSGHVTSMMPGFMLESKALTASSTAMSYIHDPVARAQDFPNLDTDIPSDVVTITLFGSGVDAGGAPAYAAKVVSLHGSRLLNPVVGRTISFGISDRGGLSLSSAGAGTVTATGFGRIEPVSGSTAPSGIAIFGFRRNGVLVSEAAVPAAAAMLSGRIYAEMGGPVGTGIAIVNPNNQDATVSFYFTDVNGTNFGAGVTTLLANHQIAKFLDQAPFNGGSTINGTFTFVSDVPVGVIALRSFINEAQNFMMTTLPVSPLSAAVGETIYFPHFADGGGWTSQLVLVNPTDTPMTGTAFFYDEGTATVAAAPVAVSIDGVTASQFTYSIPARSSRKLRTSGAGSSTRVGSVRVIPNLGAQTPSGVAVFSYRQSGITISEAGVPATRAAAAWRLYAEVSGGTAQILTGFALANPSAAPITVNFELTTLTGASTGMTGSLTLPALGHLSAFLNQIPGFTNLTTPFRGVLRISTLSGSGVTVVGIRGRTNENGEFLLTTTEPVNESSTPTSSPLIFPHIADSGGYTTQFILYSGTSSQTSAGVLRTYANDGTVLNLPLQ